MIAMSALLANAPETRRPVIRSGGANSVILWIDARPYEVHQDVKAEFRRLVTLISSLASTAERQADALRRQ